MQVHESSQPITRCKAWQPRAGSAVDRFCTGCHVDAMAAVWQNHIDKNIKITFKLRASIHNRIANFFMEAWRYDVGTVLLEIVPPFSYKARVPQTALLPIFDRCLSSTVAETPAKYIHYCQDSNLSRTLVGNKIVDHSDVAGASPVGTAPTTSLFST